MAPDKQKVKLCAALLTGIMVSLMSRRGFQRAHALLDQPAVLAVGRDDPALAALANDQARTGVDGPQIVDFERLSLSGDRRLIALDPGDRPPVAVVDYRYVAGVRCDGGKRIIRRRDQRANVGGRQPVDRQSVV